MKISYRWLGELVGPDGLSPDEKELAGILTGLGLALEEIVSLQDDHILDLEVTTNRPDCLSHLGVAREVAAYLRLPLVTPDFSENSGSGVPVVQVVVENPELCPRYAARVLQGVRIQESPDWLKARLTALGQRPINNIVDITNFLLLEIGHPLHAFDYDLLNEHRILVRTARAGEHLVTLDGGEHRLDESMLVIADASRPVALAGIMGGQESEISEGTTTILLESAYFDPLSVRRTAKRLGLRTEASFRFERGADPGIPVQALNRACRLVQEIAGGHLVGPVIDVYPKPVAERIVTLRRGRIEGLLGAPIGSEFVADTLSHLGFRVTAGEGEQWQVGVPSFRVDVSAEEDLVEEVGRHYGYDRIESTYPKPADGGRFLPTEGHDRALVSALEGLGFFEAFNYAFTTPAGEAAFWNETASMVAISNPLTEEETHLRVSLIPGLVKSLRHNLNHGNENVRLFEFGKVFIPGVEQDVSELREESRLGLLASGAWYRPYWSDGEDAFGFHHLKGITNLLFQCLGRKMEVESAPQVPFLHPGMSARIVHEGRALGYFGALHPRLQQVYKFLQPVLVAELMLDPLYEMPLPIPSFENWGRLPSSERDLSFVVDNGVEYATILGVVKSLAIPNLHDLRLIDLYRGQKLPRGKVSLTLRLTFTHPDKTLTQEEVQVQAEKILSALEKTFSAQPRS